MAKAYTAAPGAQFSDDQAQVYGEWIEAEAARRGHQMTPPELVEAGRSPDCPLHDYFEADAEKCVRAHHLQQARHLLNHLQVTIIREQHEPTPVRAFHVVEATDEAGGRTTAYVFVKKVMSDDAMSRQVIDRALREVESWRRRTALLRECAEIRPIHRAIESVTAQRKRVEKAS